MGRIYSVYNSGSRAREAIELAKRTLAKLKEIGAR